MPPEAITPVESWGRLSREPHTWLPLTNVGEVPHALRAGRPGIAHGAGRSYGDAALNPHGALWATRGLDRFIHFDQAGGVLRCEAGALLRDIQRLALPRGWMLPVTPGTQIVTVGGAIANDVHGKNHHLAGTFGHHLRRIRLARSDGEVLDIAPQGPHAALFAATVGGLGLTGVITEADLQLERSDGPWLKTETIPFGTLDEFFALSAESERTGWVHTVSWLDCLSRRSGTRGIFLRANPAAGVERDAPLARSRHMPFTPPVSLVNPLSLKAFNFAYYHAQRRKARHALAHYERFFYPLDNLHGWNRMYGPHGFYQYQSVVPSVGGREAVQAMLTAISRAGQGSFLAVLKTLGELPSLGLLSFAQPGVTLALDFPNRGGATLALLARLDAIVHAAGGRVYLAKDARWPRARFEAAYPHLAEFLLHRDPGISSAMSRRLMGK
ncbi:FAD-binding oxidoreductase [Ottowia testudinis]|uniref:FAD-binding oxidoreductase n=2 Tax=Ottowia testudinis TaxID=2816950 RepID=A0A975CKL3_9BURK|nr:FAD-binding oxidoreductase [Ottowia testudinis]